MTEYIYAGYISEPGIVDQIDPSTMTLVKTFTAPTGHNIVTSLTYDGTYIYAGYDTSPGIVYQIDPSTMTLVNTFTAPTGHNGVTSLTYDGTYIYAGYVSEPGIVDQIDPSTMTLVKTFTAPTGHNNVNVLTYDSKYIYVEYGTNPGIVDQINPATMTLVNTFTAPSGQGIPTILIAGTAPVRVFIYDGTYIDAGYGTSPGIVDQINPATMTLVNTFTAPSGHDYISSSTYDGTYIYTGYKGGIIDQIDPSTMTVVKSYHEWNYSVVFLIYDGTYIYAGYYTSPGIVDQIDPSTMTLVKSFTAPSGHGTLYGLTQNVIKGNNYAVFGTVPPPLRFFEFIGTKTRLKYNEKGQLLTTEDASGDLQVGGKLTVGGAINTNSTIMGKWGNFQYTVVSTPVSFTGTSKTIATIPFESQVGGNMIAHADVIAYNTVLNDGVSLALNVSGTNQATITHIQEGTTSNPSTYVLDYAMNTTSAGVSFNVELNANTISGNIGTVTYAYLQVEEK